MTDEMRLIDVGGREVGLVGLDELFAETSLRAADAEPDALRRELLEGASRCNYVLDGGSELDRTGPTWRGIPRRHIEWYPTIDDGTCDGCRKCLDFCSFGVLVFSAEHAIVEVENRYACVVGCSLCASLCAVGAITFPPLSYLDRFRPGRT